MSEPKIMSGLSLSVRKTPTFTTATTTTEHAELHRLDYVRVLSSSAPLSPWPRPLVSSLLLMSPSLRSLCPSVTPPVLCPITPRLYSLLMVLSCISSVSLCLHLLSSPPFHAALPTVWFLPLLFILPACCVWFLFLCVVLN